MSSNRQFLARKMYFFRICCLHPKADIGMRRLSYLFDALWTKVGNIGHHFLLNAFVHVGGVM